MPARFVAGVDLGASNVRVVIANEDGEIEARRAGPLPPGSPDDVLSKIGRTIDELVRGVWVGAAVAGIGVALPGAIDPASGAAQSVANMPGWDNIPIAEILGRPRAVPVAVENDANAAAVGEGWAGAARGLRDFVFLALGTGIGGGVVLDGRLRSGAHRLAGEVAFFRMTREQLREASWESGLESIVGGRAAANKAVELLGSHGTPQKLFEAASSGDAPASAWLTETLEYLAMAVCDIIAVLDPEMIVFGGGVVHAQGPSILAPVREAVRRCMPVPVPIEASTLGEDAQVLGAVRLALDKLEAARAAV